MEHKIITMYKLNLYLDMKTLLLFFRVQLQLRSAISGSSHLRFQYGKATFYMLHKATDSHFSFSAGGTKYIYQYLMKIIELEQVKELLSMVFQ